MTLLGELCLFMSLVDSCVLYLWNRKPFLHSQLLRALRDRKVTSCFFEVFASSPRAFLVFGDSLVDSGNNNYLLTTPRADAPPYGIDYPTTLPTGRFSNGYNIPDLISQEIGSESVLPYLSPEMDGQKLLTGANFASAGIGILKDTGIQFLDVIRMYRQLEYFEEYKQRVSVIVGCAEAERLVNRVLVLVCVGGNDFVNNYYLVPFSARSRQYPDIADYVKYLVEEYGKLLQNIYQMGARRVLVTGSGPMGCVPAELVLRRMRYRTAKSCISVQSSARRTTNMAATFSSPPIPTRCTMTLSATLERMDL